MQNSNDYFIRYITMIIISTIFLTGCTYGLDGVNRNPSVKIKAGQEVKITNLGFLKKTIHVKYNGFVTGTTFQLTAFSVWPGKASESIHHVDSSFIEIQIDRLTYKFKIMKISPSHIILKSR